MTEGIKENLKKFEEVIKGNETKVLALMAQGGWTGKPELLEESLKEFD